nr:uncharacterized protein LOC104119208 [Nicotiana tomentosiformis]
MASYKQKLEQAREKLDIVHNQIQQDPLAQDLFDLEKDTLANIEKWSNIEEQELDIVKEDIFAVVKNFFSNSSLPGMINTIAITLVPKVSAPSTVKDHRPIACCTTVYKIISKVITKRIKSVLDGLIGHSQSAFIEGRCIIENILLSHELFKGYSRKGVSPRCALKVDLRKAYDTLEEIVEALGFTEGKLPFKYLGIPVDEKKLAVHQYLPLIEKIIARITCWLAKLLSYAGRCQLIKAVIFGIQTYWAQIFVIPKKMMKAIEAICRTFLWTGNATISKKALVAWEKVCRPVAAGGLNILDIKLWNKEAIIKHLWDITRKKDCLWIMWVHNFYIKNRNLEIMVTPKATSWVVKKILESRSLIIEYQQLQGNIHNRLQTMCKNAKFQIK